MKTLMDFGLRLDEGVAARFPVFLDEVDRDVVVESLPLGRWFSEKPLTFHVRRLDSLCGRSDPLGALVLGASGPARANLRGASEAIRRREPIVLVRTEAGGASHQDLLVELRDLAPYETVEPFALPPGAGKAPAAGAAVFATPHRMAELSRAKAIAGRMILGEPVDWQDELSRYFEADEALQALRHRNASRVIQPDAFIATDGLHDGEGDDTGHRWRWGGARSRISVCFEPETPGRHRVRVVIESAVHDRLGKIALVAVNGRATPFSISGANPAVLSLVATLPDLCVIQIGCNPIPGWDGDHRALSLALGKTTITRLDAEDD